MKRNNLIIILGGALLVFVLVFASLRAATSTAATLLAARPIAAGTRLSADDLTTQPINTSSRLTTALGKPDEAIGKVILIARAPGDQITADQVSDQAGVGLPAHLEPGTVAIGVHVNLASGLGGALREGDTVSVIAVLDPKDLGGDGNFNASLPVTVTTTSDITVDRHPAARNHRRAPDHHRPQSAARAAGVPLRGSADRPDRAVVARALLRECAAEQRGAAGRAGRAD